MPSLQDKKPSYVTVYSGNTPAGLCCVQDVMEEKRGRVELLQLVGLSVRIRGLTKWKCDDHARWRVFHVTSKRQGRCFVGILPTASLFMWGSEGQRCSVWASSLGSISFIIDCGFNCLSCTHNAILAELRFALRQHFASETNGGIDLKKSLHDQGLFSLVGMASGEVNKLRVFTFFEKRTIDSLLIVTLTVQYGCVGISVTFWTCNVTFKLSVERPYT